ncbi:MAG TPA: hypothetical protein VGN63_05380 [Flavisolibacter sp.]|nr:hypothetical protein [Flavisolibacter sp.]
MAAESTILHTLYAIVKEDPQPTAYPCRPRELILRLEQDWHTIQAQLNQLENEGYIRTRQSPGGLFWTFAATALPAYVPSRPVDRHCLLTC